MRQGDHLCLIYHSREEQLAAAVPFIKAGLLVGERCVYIADDLTLSDVRAHLAAAGIRVDHEEGRGALLLLTKRDTYLRDGSFDPEGMISFLAEAEKQALADGFEGLRVTGEMTWALGGEHGNDRIIEYESKLNKYFPGSRALAICQYSKPRFSPEVLRDVLLTHPVAIVGERVCANPYFRPEQAGRAGGPKEDVAWMLEQLQALHRGEEALETARRQAAAQEKLSTLGMLVSGVAHEIRTPLTYAMTNLHLIDRRLKASGAEEGPLREQVTEALQGLERVSRIVADLRRFLHAAPDEGGPADLAEVATAATNLFRATVSHEVYLRMDLRAASAAHVDPLKLQQVVLNLLSNAAEAVGPGGQIVVRTRAEGGEALIEVEDKGPGIPPDVRARLFEPLFTTKSEGTGLGLSIVRRIVEEHSGTIEVASTPGEGARFTVRLPASPGPTPSPPS
ncbi:MAG TPA: MEDS domain-containing protein [Candidatus Thermoplasmatota archaeon]|nr:MEDS domain-containing protein [Candidatus Thermoplasmatota archaeon]